MIFIPSLCTGSFIMSQPLDTLTINESVIKLSVVWKKNLLLKKIFFVSLNVPRSEN